MLILQAVSSVAYSVPQETQQPEQPEQPGVGPLSQAAPTFSKCPALMLVCAARGLNRPVLLLMIR